MCRCELVSLKGYFYTEVENNHGNQGLILENNKQTDFYHNKLKMF